MQRFVNVPLIFLFIGSLLGLFLRWQFISPISGINYMNFLHGHSHIMFLGWVFNALFIGFTLDHFEDRLFKNAFIVLQALVFGMLLSFSLQGYDFFSILFSTSHTLIAIVFVIKFYNKTRNVTSISVRYAKVALVFFVISTAGPFSLAYLISAGLEQSQWYYFSIYFYLHFQYNGCFLFGILALLFQIFENKQIDFSKADARTFGIILAASCVPAYLLSTLWAKPGYVYNIIGGSAALVQLFALVILVRFAIATAKQIRQKLLTTSYYLLLVMVISFFAKLILQLLSALPVVSELAYELRSVTIAYLHLVLVGIISVGLFVWYFESGLLERRYGNQAILVFIPSYIGMEACLILSPWWNSLVGSDFRSAAVLTFLFSAFLTVSCLLLLISASIKKLTKISG